MVAAWIASRMLTDRVWWMQYPWWVPTLAWLALAVLLLGAWWGVDALHAWHRRRRDGTALKEARRRRARCVLAGLILLMLVHASFVEWRLYRWVAPVRAVEADVRIANWNPAVPVETLHGPIMELDADVIAIVNQPGSNDVDDLAASLGEDWQVIRLSRLSVISRLPIKRWGFTDLGLEGRVMNSWRFRELDIRMTEQYDEGRALFVEVGVGDELLVLWVVDLPSDVTLPRRQVMVDAADVLSTYEGRVRRFEGGEAVVERIEGGFPEPDVIVGDFNTIRGSWSLRGLVGDRTNAFDAAGRGWGATFPRTLPLAQIDQMFVGDGWRTTRYLIFDPGSGHHRAQVGDLVITGP